MTSRASDVQELVKKLGLNPQQTTAVMTEGHVMVTACPGSGKTRLLTARVGKGLLELPSRRKMVAAITFTNRAADEVSTRLNLAGVGSENLWVSTIHSFCLQWIIRPYAGLIPELRAGFRVLDAYEEQQLVRSIRQRHAIPWYEPIPKRRDRYGQLHAGLRHSAALEYLGLLSENKLLDFDALLYISYRTLAENDRVARTVAGVFDLICIDELQDLSDLQHGIIGWLVRAASSPLSVFMVGDPNQAIYGSLHGVSLTIDDLRHEFGGAEILERQITGCYRSPQRLVDFWSRFQVVSEPVNSIGDNRTDDVSISHRSDVHFSEIFDQIASIVERHRSDGIPDNEICIVAPQWRMVLPCARAIARRIPGARLDAPGLTPFREHRDSIFFSFARLLLTPPDPRNIAVRFRCAELLCLQLTGLGLGRSPAGNLLSPRSLLGIINSVYSDRQDGIQYLKECAGQVLSLLGLDEGAEPIRSAYKSFFDGAAEFCNKHQDSDFSTAALKSLFQERNGIAVNTCHGLKGEEFLVVIAYGLLQGYLPHWENIKGDQDGGAAASRQLLYVVCSRSKKHLYLFSETGHTTTTGKEYLPTVELVNVVVALHEGS